MPPWRRSEPGKLVLSLYVQPGAKRSEIAGLHGGALKIRLAAPALEGKANAELVRFLAQAFGVPQNRVLLKRGEHARSKVVEIIAPAQLPQSLPE